MAQKFLDPDPTKIVAVGNWNPSGPVPPHIRKFKHFPNIDDWLPGDLLLISAIKPGWVSKRIIQAQIRGGYVAEDARWHHAAVYLGEANVCEALGRGVQLNPIFKYVGTHFLR